MQDASDNTIQAPESSVLHQSLVDKLLLVESASGIYITLTDGRKILDGCAGAAVAALGHGNKEVHDAVIKQMNKVAYVHHAVYTTDTVEELANLILDGNPYGFSKAYFIGSGSEAMDSALKLARQYHFENGDTQRTRFVARRQAYHGNTIGAMSVGSNMPRKIPYQDAILTSNVSFVSAANIYRGQRDDETEEQFGERLVDELEAEFLSVGPETVIAFIAEPVVGATAGCLTPPRGYFKGVRRVCDKYGILLILDEVMCGIGRTGTYFAFEQECGSEGDLQPDLLAFGKGIGAGFAPLAGLLIHEKVVDRLRRGSGEFVHGHTYEAHAAVCAAALAVQKIIRRDDLVARCAEKGQVLERLLREAFGDSAHVGDIRGRGLFWGLEFVRDRKTKEPFGREVRFTPKVVGAAMRLGLAVYPGGGTADGIRGDHVLIAPPLVVTDEELVLLVGRLKGAYEEVVRGMETVQEVARL